MGGVVLTHGELHACVGTRFLLLNYHHFAFCTFRLTTVLGVGSYPGIINRHQPWHGHLKTETVDALAS